MFLTKLSLNRPVSVILFLFTLMVFGLNSLFGFNMAYMPAIEMPTYIVVTPYIGAEPEIVDKTISTEVEKIGATISGFSESTTISEESMSTVIFSFDFGVDKNQTYLDLKAAVDQLSLPADAMDPVILQMSFDATSMMSLSITSEDGEDALSFADDYIVPQIETLLGVAEVNVYGGQEDYVRVVADPTKMHQYGVTLQSIGSSIAMYDFALPLGTMDQGLQEANVSSGAEITSLAQLNDVPVVTSTGDIISLKEVARVMIGARDADTISRYNGIENVMVEITNAQDANIPTVSKNIITALDKIRVNNPNFSIDITNDASDLILDTLFGVVETLAIGISLCMIVLYVFLGDVRASLIVGSAIPISLFATLICMNAAGFELNMVTANALVIAIGLMVDNAIVVLESIFKVKGEDPQYANLNNKETYKAIAYRGCNLVGTSVVASTITTIVVYLPLSVLGGVSGQLFSQLSFTIIFAMVASLISATTIVPMLYFLLKPEEKRSMTTSIMEKLEKNYVTTAKKVIKHPGLVMFFSVALLVGSFALLYVIPLGLIPETDTGKLLIEVDFRPNSKLEVMSEVIKPLEDKILNDDRIDGYQMSISGNTANITAFMKGDLGAKPLIQEYQNAGLSMKDMSLQVTASGDEMMEAMIGNVTLITTTLHSYDYEALKIAAEEFEAKVYEIPGVSRVASSQGTWGSMKAEINIDPRKTLNHGLDPTTVAQMLRLAVTGFELEDMEIGSDEYDVIIEYPADYSDDLHSLMNLSIDTPTGKVPLSQMAEMSFTDTLQSIKKINGYYCIDLTIIPVEGAYSVVSEGVSLLETSETNDVAGIYVGAGPGTDFILDEVGAMAGAIVTAVFLVFMVMAMQFQSLRFSMMVMTSVSFSFIGSFGLMFLMGQTLTLISMMGVLMLMGIVVNNGILFVDSTDKNTRECDTLEEALIKSGQTRMRPIIMTTITTVLAMVPLALAEGDSMQSMGIIIIGGLLASTVLVLYLMPAFYMILSKKEKSDTPNDKCEITSQ